MQRPLGGPIVSSWATIFWIPSNTSGQEITSMVQVQLNQDEPSHTQVATKKLLKSFLLILLLPTALMTNSLIDNRHNLLTIVLRLPLPVTVSLIADGKCVDWDLRCYLRQSLAWWWPWRRWPCHDNVTHEWQQWQHCSSQLRCEATAVPLNTVIANNFWKQLWISLQTTWSWY